MQQQLIAPILKVDDLEIIYTTRKGPLRAIRDVSFSVRPGDSLGIVGESGCGKSTLAYGVMNYIAKNGQVTNGKILFDGDDILKRSQKELNHIRGNKVAMVYQDPMSALNPSMRIGDQLTEVLAEHADKEAKLARKHCLEMLERVRIPDQSDIMERYPHQLSVHP